MSDGMMYARFGCVDDPDAKVDEVPEGWNPLAFDPDDRSLVYLDSLPKEGSFYKWLSRSGQEGYARLKDVGSLCFHFYPNHAGFELSDAVAWQPIDPDGDGGYEHGKKPNVCPFCGFTGTFTWHPVYMSNGRVVHICPRCYEAYCRNVRKLYAQGDRKDIPIRNANARYEEGEGPHMERYERALEKFEDYGGQLGDWGHSTVYLVRSEMQLTLAKKCVAYGKTSEYLIERQGLPNVYGWYEGPGWYRAVAHEIQSLDEKEIEQYEYTMKMVAPYIVARKEL